MGLFAVNPRIWLVLALLFLLALARRLSKQWRAEWVARRRARQADRARR